MDNRELWLATTIVELAEALDADPAEVGYEDRLTTRLAELLAPAEVALLIANDVGRLTAAAASTNRARNLASLQARLHEGPCVESHQTGQPVLNELIGTAGTRWPRLAPAAVGAGFGIVSALPMRRREQAVGVICAAAQEEHRLTEADVRLAEVLARTAALGIAQQRDLRRSAEAAEQLRRALESRVVIEQAKGAVAARLGITPHEAFELLRAYARRASRTLAEVAGETIRQELPTHDLVAARGPGRSKAGRG
jgi:GAF domain-containing protein